MMFPEITHIDQVLPHVRGRSDFAIKDQGEYISIDYIFAGSDTFDHPMQRECRGLKFLKSGELLARPYHKFFNLGEKPETQPHVIDWTQPHDVLNKLDGSMVHPALLGGGVVFMTRAGITSISEDAGRYAEDHGYLSACREIMNQGYTPIFEWISPGNQIVVRYPYDQLVLTAVRCNRSGHYQDTLRGLGLPDWVGTFSNEIEDLDAFVAHTKGLPDEEGYVIRFESGLMVKMKADAYVMRHKARDSLFLEKNVLRVVMENATDDVLPLLPPEDAARLSEYAFKVTEGVLSSAASLSEFVANGKAATENDRKRFALEIIPLASPLLKGAAFLIWQGANPDKVVREVVLKHTGSSNDVELVRELMGGAIW